MTVVRCLDESYSKLVDEGVKYVMESVYIPEGEGIDIDDYADDIVSYANEWVDDYGKDSLDEWIDYRDDCLAVAKATGNDEDWSRLEDKYTIHISNVYRLGLYSILDWYSNETDNLKDSIIDTVKERIEDKYGVKFSDWAF